MCFPTQPTSPRPVTALTLQQKPFPWRGRLLRAIYRGRQNLSDGMATCMVNLTESKASMETHPWTHPGWIIMTEVTKVGRPILNAGVPFYVSRPGSGWKGESELSTSVQPSLLPRHGCNVTDCLQLLLPQLCDLCWDFMAFLSSLLLRQLDSCW